ncbi:MAG: NAD(+)/NADH kinase [Candidatus Thermoplasmatota archaeon]
MRLGVLANPEIPDAKRLAKRVVRLLQAEGVEHMVDEPLARSLRLKAPPLDYDDAEVLVTIGGDGTVLRALERSMAKVLSINAGQVGFLTEVKPEEVEKRLMDFLRGQYLIDERIKLKVYLNRRRLMDCTNEAVVHTAHISKMRQFMVWIDGELAMEIRADGMIIATPTGSTCYAMSAGGPIIDPKVEAFVIAPLAAYKPFIRPIVVPAKSDIVLRFGRRRDCLLVLDGQYEERVRSSAVLRFSKSEAKAEFIRFRKGYYERMKEQFGI